MFHFPEPEPLDYYIDDVSPSFLTDGVLLRGKLEPVHKCVGKQLRPIKRKPSDPVGPIRKVDSCTLERWANKERSGYVNKCGENAWAVHDMMKLFPVRKFDSRKSQSSRVSIFPRSKQYEYDYTRDGRMCNSELGNEENLKCIKIEESPNYETKTKHDYTEKCVKSNISEKVQMEDKKCSVPDPLIKSEYHRENKMRDGIDRVDDRKVEIRKEKNSGNVTYACKRLPCKHGKTLLCHVKIDGALNANEAEKIRKDSRWRPLRKVLDAPRDKMELREEMSKVSKPYLHELNKWYSENKPSKIFPREHL
ncbi:uncharacterized protein LOC107263389 isoform X1 [Cephus cinctus]|uniref:Uncharacterized protein LOC107263389 isoform X1 n=1 Tax=Cephus cinctus TaxID=211228 RepID=A0AAJ7BH91_CEPCN|nr:uncharacterized protein LOC107263389 isoform X1 [Cephus cinctus]